MNRVELLEMLVEMSRENETLRDELERQEETYQEKMADLKEKYEERIKTLQAQLDDRTIKIENAGSIAEASLQINNVFEAAQAAEQYLVNIRNREKVCSEMEGKAASNISEKLMQAEMEADRRIRVAEEKAKSILANAETRAEKKKLRHAEE